MTVNCRGCGERLHGRGNYCTCGAHSHDGCLEGHADWCALEGRDSRVGAVEF